MNENKRFVNIGNEIHLNGGWWCSANGEHCADVIATALNELLEENQQYQKWLDALREELSLADRDNTALEKENKELKGKVSSWKITASEEISEKQELVKQIVELKKENRALQFKIIEMLDFVKEKGTVTREDIKKWWNKRR